MTIPEPPSAPALPDGATDDVPDMRKDRYTHQLDAWLERWKEEVAAQAVASALAASREDTDRAAEADLLKSIHDAYISVTQSSLDRALTRLNVLTGSVASIITIYTGLLALVFAAKPGEGERLTVVAVIPGLFLGISLLCATYYAAVFRNERNSGSLLPTGIGGRVPERRLIAFMDWTFSGVLARAWALHAGIMSLAVGVITLPLPFVRLAGPAQVAIFVGGLLAVAISGAVAYSRRPAPG